MTVGFTYIIHRWQTSRREWFCLFPFATSTDYRCTRALYLHSIGSEHSRHSRWSWALAAEPEQRLDRLDHQVPLRVRSLAQMKINLWQKRSASHLPKKRQKRQRRPRSRNLQTLVRNLKQHIVFATARTMVVRWSDVRIARTGTSFIPPFYTWFIALNFFIKVSFPVYLIDRRWSEWNR